MDERGRVWLRESGGNLREESLHLDLAVSAQAGSDAIEVAIVVAGMADEFEDAVGGHGGEDLGKGRGVEISGGGDAESSAGGADGSAAEL